MQQSFRLAVEIDSNASPDGWYMALDESLPIVLATFDRTRDRIKLCGIEGEFFVLARTWSEYIPFRPVLWLAHEDFRLTTVDALVGLLGAAGWRRVTRSEVLVSKDGEFCHPPRAPS